MYMRIPIHQIPTAIYNHYKLHKIEHKGFVNVDIRKGMHGLPQDKILANKKPLPHLGAHRYYPCASTHGLFKHNTCPIAFSLVVHDFCIKYIGKEHANHLLKTLQTNYTVTVDWDRTSFLGMRLAWNYTNRTMDMSMPEYVAKALQRFQHASAVSTFKPYQT
jgi:hypothetical protein